MWQGLSKILARLRRDIKNHVMTGEELCKLTVSISIWHLASGWRSCRRRRAKGAFLGCTSRDISGARLQSPSGSTTNSINTLIIKHIRKTHANSLAKECSSLFSFDLFALFVFLQTASSCASLRDPKAKMGLRPATLHQPRGDRCRQFQVTSTFQRHSNDVPTTHRADVPTHVSDTVVIVLWSNPSRMLWLLRCRSWRYSSFQGIQKKYCLWFTDVYGILNVAGHAERRQEGGIWI